MADPSMQIKTHLSLNVSNVDRSVAFYEAFFGAPAHKRRPGYANFDLNSPPLKFALVERPIQSGAGALNHLGLQVATREQVEAARNRLIAAGLATFDEKDATCCYALQDKVWAHDPDGNAWEVYVLLDDMLDDDEPDDDATMALAPPPIDRSQPILLMPGRPAEEVLLLMAAEAGPALFTGRKAWWRNLEYRWYNRSRPGRCDCGIA